MVTTMNKNEIKLSYVIMILPLFILTAAPMVQASWLYQENISIDAVQIRPGDIIFCYSPSMDPIIPGYWTHIVIFVGFDHEGCAWAIESYNVGVHYIRIRSLLSRDYGDLALGRVDADSSQIGVALAFAHEQLGKPYDYRWYSKQVHGDSYYCSELAWASYFVAGVDIDENPGWSFKYANGVAPQELFDDADVTIYWRAPARVRENLHSSA